MICPRTRVAIELAWFRRVSIHTLALQYSLKPATVRGIWHRAKDRGDLPRITRPYGGPLSWNQPKRKARAV